MHEAAGDALGVRCHYQLIEVSGADAAGLRALLEGVRRLGFAGVNVTFPYKETVVPLLDEMSARARDIGAVNTVVVRDGRLIGYNTDTTGFERAIADLVAASNRGAVALIGAGGVGKAIAFALANLDIAELSIFDVDRSRAERLAMQLRGRLPVRVADDVASALQDAAGVVNATPVGMLPDRGMAVPEFIGPEGYGVVSGALTMPTNVMRAVGPLAASLVWGAFGGYTVVRWGLAGIMLVAAMGFAAAAWLSKRHA